MLAVGLPLSWEGESSPRVTKGWFPQISSAGQRHIWLVDANGTVNFAQHGDRENSVATNFSQFTQRSSVGSFMRLPSLEYLLKLPPAAI